MRAFSDLRSTVARGIVELRRPGEGDLPGRALWRMGQAVLTLARGGPSSDAQRGANRAVRTAAPVCVAGLTVDVRRAAVRILLTEPTRELLRAPHPVLVQRPGVKLKGKRETVSLFAPQS